MQSLFPANAGARGRGRVEAPLLTIKAGKCELEATPNGKFKVTADIRKGQITVTRGSDGLRHFKWGDRAGSVVDDLIVFPEEASFARVKTGRENDRVYILKFNSGSRRFMFWMQDKDEEKDEANCAKLNQLLNSSAADEPSSIAEQPLSAIAGGGGAPAGMNPDQWMQMLGLPPGQQAAAAAANHVPTATSIAPNSTLGSLDLSSLLGNTAPATSFANAANTARSEALAAEMQRIRANQSGTNDGMAHLSLSHVLTPAAVRETGILNDPNVVAELAQHLPEGQQSAHGVDTNLQSPQFQQSLDTLTHALHSDSYNSVLANLGLDPEPGTAELARGDNTGAFLASVQAAHPATQPKEEQKSAGDCVPSNSQAHEEKDDASGEGEKKMEH